MGSMESREGFLARKSKFLFSFKFFSPSALLSIWIDNFHVSPRVSELVLTIQKHLETLLFLVNQYTGVA